MKIRLPEILFIALVGLVTIVFFNLIEGYLLAIFWAVILAILFHDVNDQIVERTNKPNLAAAMTLLLIIAIVVIPAGLVGLALLDESTKFIDGISEDRMGWQATFEDLRGRLPILEQTLSRFGIDVSELQKQLQNAVANFSQFFANRLLQITQNIFSFLIQFFLMGYVLFFFLRDGGALVESLIKVLPLGDEKERALFQRFEKVSRATVKGSLVVAIVQGTIGGILFWALDIPAAVLWGVVMVIGSLLPLGSALVWLPAGVGLLIQGNYVDGTIMLLVGSMIIGVIDNFLRPRLVGQDTKLPDYLILLSTLGGINWFGISGFVIGPVIAALFITSWQMLGKDWFDDDTDHYLADDEE